MIDNHTFVDAHYADNERKILKTLWLDNSGENTRPYYINVEKDNDVFEKFINQTKRNADGELVPITDDWLNERTFKVIRENRKRYEDTLINIAKRNNEYMDIITDAGVNHDLLLQYLDDTRSSTDKEIFQLKLKMFEKDHVVKSEDRELKMRLRKAQTIKECMLLYLKF